MVANDPNHRGEDLPGGPYERNQKNNDQEKRHEDDLVRIDPSLLAVGHS